MVSGEQDWNSALSGLIDGHFAAERPLQSSNSLHIDARLPPSTSKVLQASSQTAQTDAQELEAGIHQSQSSTGADVEAGEVEVKILHKSSQ